MQMERVNFVSTFQKVVILLAKAVGIPFTQPQVSLKTLVGMLTLLVITLKELLTWAYVLLMVKYVVTTVDHI